MLKNLSVGLVVSYFGSIPLGYLNMIGLEIFRLSGLGSLLLFLLGIAVVEMVLIYFTLEGADSLLKNKKIIGVIEIFSIFFMLLLAASFYWMPINTTTSVNKSVLTLYPPFITGVLFNALNFIQIPFWAGWNIYLINNGYIFLDKNKKYFFVAGTSLGTILGMLTFVIVLNSLLEKVSVFSSIFCLVFPSIFLLLAVLQMYKFLRKN